MLHMLGFNHAPAFNVDYLLAPGWFISSLMIAHLCHCRYFQCGSNGPLGTGLRCVMFRDRQLVL